MSCQKYMEHIKAKKSLGQNFLKDEGVLTRILEVADIQTNNTVLEIGPGTGVLTEKLADTGAKVYAIELDHRLVERLNEHFVQSENVSILEGNILDIHLEELLGNIGYGHRAYKVVANIPYYITAPIIRTLLSLKHQPISMTLMVQNEVADRLVAKPGDMSLLSIMAQYYADVTKEFVVSREAFDPVPAVESAVVKLLPKRAFDREADRKLFQVVRAGFAARRKTLANNLSNSLHIPRETVEARLAKLNLLPTVRAQELSVEEWIRLAEMS